MGTFRGNAAPPLDEEFFRKRPAPDCTHVAVSREELPAGADGSARWAHVCRCGAKRVSELGRGGMVSVGDWIGGSDAPIGLVKVGNP